MSNTNDQTKEIALEGIITTSVQIPGVKVSRDKFLAEMFATEDVALQDVLDLGPVQAGVSRDKLSLMANKLILKRTSQSSAASFVAGIPGGLAMAATIPADVMQFFGMALRLAQELSYLYGADDLWQNGTVDEEKIKSQLIMYCGVMFGVSGAVSGVRVLSTQIAKTTLHKLPQKALTKTFWYLHMSKSQLGRMIVRIEKRALHINNQIVSGHEADLTKKERRFLSMYQRARKINLLPEVPSEVLTQFSAESAEKTAHAESNARYEEMLEAAIDDTQDNEDIGGAQA